MVLVRLFELPLECLTQEADRVLGQALGEVIMVDMDVASPTKIRFLRVKPDCN